jgi:glucose/arabinose dehydrogenase
MGGRVSCRLGALVLLAAAFLVGGVQAQDDAEPLADWAVQPGFALEVDSVGFDLPTAIAFVPNPGTAPEDPLYFVTELRGEIKVVTNDRTVHAFGQVSTVGTQKPDLSGASQQGLAGICLEPSNGYVFVTFTQPDESGILRNNIVRFDTVPGMFGLTADRSVDFAPILREAQSAPAHQIGGCVVHDGRVYVGIGDGGNVPAAQQLDVPLGKIVCLTLEGEPCPDGPFVTAEEAASRYVWAYGFRNPFGVAVAGEELFVAENGIDIDRFLKVAPGADHYWRGSDQSIATGAAVVFFPSVAPVQLAFLPEAARGFPDGYANTFFFAASAAAADTGVVSFRYDIENDSVISIPEHLVAYRGRTKQSVIGLALGPDGLYFAPSIPDESGSARILRLSYAPQHEHTVVIGTPSDPMTGGEQALLAQHACISCHNIDGQGGGIGPSLDSFGLNWRLTERLNSPAYEEQIAQVDQLADEPYVSFREARREVLAASGRDRTRVWLKHFLVEPRFDNPGVQMPNLGLSVAEAETIRNYLVGAGRAQAGIVDRGLKRVMRNRLAVAAGFLAGAASTLGLIGVVGFVWVMRRRRR